MKLILYDMGHLAVSRLLLSLNLPFKHDPLHQNAALPAKSKMAAPSFYEKSKRRKKTGGGRKKELMLEIVATNVVASQPSERRPLVQKLVLCRPHPHT